MKERASNLIYNSPQPGDKSGLKMVAHNDKVLHPRVHNIASVDLHVNKLLKDKRLAWTDRFVIEMQWLYGARISEILRLTDKDINPDGSVLCYGLKGSQARILHSRYFSDMLKNIRHSGRGFITGHSRYFYYRLYVKRGLYGLFGDNSKKSVTHCFRHYAALRLKENGVSKDVIQQFLGHKNIKSTGNYYDKEER